MTLEIKLQFPYVVPARYEHDTADDAYLHVNENIIDVVLNVAKTVGATTRHPHATMAEEGTCDFRSYDNSEKFKMLIFSIVK